MVEVGAVTPADVDRIEREIASTLKDLAANQQVLLRANDPVERFFMLLNRREVRGGPTSAVLAGQSANLLSPNPALLGWKQPNNGAGSPDAGAVASQRDERIRTLMPRTGVGTAQAGHHGEADPSNAAPCRQRLDERKLLVSVERRADGRRLRVRKNIGGGCQLVWHVPTKCRPLSSGNRASRASN